MLDTDEGVDVRWVHVLIRPSVSVVARNAVKGEVSRVNVHGRLDAGEPVKVFSTWQVMGSLAILGNRPVAGIKLVVDSYRGAWKS